MEYTYEGYGKRTAALLATGLLVGGLVGAGAMLLFAPQAGKKTSALLQKKTRALRDQALDSVDDAVERTRDGAKKLTGRARDQVEDLQKHWPGRKDSAHQWVDKGKNVLAR